MQWLLPILLFGGGIGYWLWASNKQRRMLSQPGGAAAYMAGFGRYFRLQPNEQLLTFWQVTIYDPNAIASQVGRWAKQLAAASVGIRLRYTEGMCCIGLTSFGRIVMCLGSSEHLFELSPGDRVYTFEEAYPGTTPSGDRSNPVLVFVHNQQPIALRVSPEAVSALMQWRYDPGQAVAFASAALHGNAPAVASASPAV